MATTPLVLTPNDVRQGGGSTCNTLTAGEALLGFQFLYTGSDNKKYKAVNSGTVLQATVDGVCLTPAAIDEPVTFIPIANGVSRVQSASASFVKGQWYVLSDTAGSIMTAADLVGETGTKASLVAYAVSTTELILFTQNTGEDA